jgi:glycosyltransferase involved in cell wall biosynthesis
MKFSLVIPAYNEEQYIGACLDSVFQNAPGGFAEIIVVDNGSTDRTVDIARQYPGVRVIFEEAKGVTFTRQRGLNEASGPLVAFIDADSRLPAGWIDIARQTFAADANVVGLSGPYRYYDGSRLDRLLLDATGWLLCPISYWLFGHMVIGGNFVARKEALEAIQGFDRLDRLYGEDSNVGRRLCERGRVAFRSDFFALTSGRRFYQGGIFKEVAKYSLNYLWVVFFHRSFTTSYDDVRGQY